MILLLLAIGVSLLPAAAHARWRWPGWFAVTLTVLALVAVHASRVWSSEREAPIFCYAGPTIAALLVISGSAGLALRWAEARQASVRFGVATVSLLAGLPLGIATYYGLLLGYGCSYV